MAKQVEITEEDIIAKCDEMALNDMKITVRSVYNGLGNRGSMDRITRVVGKWKADHPAEKKAVVPEVQVPADLMNSGSAFISRIWSEAVAAAAIVNEGIQREFDKFREDTAEEIEDLKGLLGDVDTQLNAANDLIEAETSKFQAALAEKNAELAAAVREAATQAELRAAAEAQIEPLNRIVRSAEDAANSAETRQQFAEKRQATAEAKAEKLAAQLKDQELELVQLKANLVASDEQNNRLMLDRSNAEEAAQDAQEQAAQADARAKAADARAQVAEHQNALLAAEVEHLKKAQAMLEKSVQLAERLGLKADENAE